MAGMKKGCEGGVELQFSPKRSVARVTFRKRSRDPQQPDPQQQPVSTQRALILERASDLLAALPVWSLSDHILSVREIRTMFATDHDSWMRASLQAASMVSDGTLFDLDEESTGGHYSSVYLVALRRLIMVHGLIAPGEDFSVADFPFLITSDPMFVNIEDMVAGPGVDLSVALSEGDLADDEIEYSSDWWELAPLRDAPYPGAATVPLVVKMTPTEGLSLWTPLPIASGHLVFELFGVVRYTTEFSRSVLSRDANYSWSLRSVGGRRMLMDGRAFSTIGRLCNHSDTPNVEIFVMRVKPDVDGGVARDRVFGFTTRDVKAGEELTVSYGSAYMGAGGNAETMGWVKKA